MKRSQLRRSFVDLTKIERGRADATKQYYLNSNVASNRTCRAFSVVSRTKEIPELLLETI